MTKGQSIEHVDGASDSNQVLVALDQPTEHLLVHIDLDTGRHSTLDRIDGEQQTLRPVLGENGAYGYWADTSEEQTHLARASVTGSDLTRFPIDNKSAAVVDVSPSDRYVLYTARDESDGEWNLHRYDTYRETERKLAESVGSNGGRYSPDGAFIVFTSVEGEGPQPHIINTSDNSLEALPLPVEGSPSVVGWDSSIGLLFLHDSDNDRWAEFSVDTLTYNWHSYDAADETPIDVLPDGRILTVTEEDIKTGKESMTDEGENVRADPDRVTTTPEHVVYVAEDDNEVVYARKSTSGNRERLLGSP